MRIAMLGSRGIPARTGGVEHAVEDLTGELVARGHEVLVYCREHYTGPSPQPAAGTAIVTPGLPGKHLDAITHTATAAMDLLRRNVDVVHIHSPGPALMSWLPALAGKPVVLTIHAADWGRDKWSGFAKFMLKAGLSCGMRSARVVTSVSPSLASELSSRFSREVMYIPNAVRPAEPRPVDTIRQWALSGDDYTLCVGRIVPEKRLHVLLEAWSQLDRHQKLVIVGDADESDYARKCRASAGENVLFTGPQYGDTLAELYSNAALVVLPSALEGMPLVLLEAASYGRCIIASDIPANTDIMGENALYFRCDEVIQLCEQIRRCLSTGQLRTQVGEKARAYVESAYSWARSAELVEKAYERAVLRKV